MGSKKFLTPFAIVAASFASDNAIASPTQSIDASSSEVSKLAQQMAPFKMNTSESELNFVVKRSSETGHMMASHASHESHSSHYSSRN